ncbi:hypothetical protein E2C01_038508 [Portunus trituberculatus]|uniref:Uncharacterized protein n=1 Tax=Portunus trituberculatus TaxID=210409 RepID=A0A5B7FIQ4_PORTR|nr:hypothetical protein [Portunus trituberculatus]
MNNGYVVMVDIMNTRFGRKVRDLAELYELPGFTCSYPDKEDSITHMNHNAESVNIICDLDVAASLISECLYECVQSSKGVIPTGGGGETDARLGKWEKLLSDADDARVWRAISWKGDLETSTPDNENRPSDDEFKFHLERVLNPDPLPPLVRATADVTIPILDDPISPTEVDCQIRKLKVNKACEPDGLFPGVLTMLFPAPMSGFDDTKESPAAIHNKLVRQEHHLFAAVLHALLSISTMYQRRR